MKKVQVFLIVSLLLFSGCAGKSRQQNNIPAKTPRRIVSLAPSITEELFLLDAGDRVVGVTTYCQRPEEARRKESVGTMLAPSVEKIVSLKPDLVLATQEGNRREVVEKIQSAGLRVFTFGRDESLESIWGNFLLLGKIMGKEQRAEEILRDLNRRMFRVKRRVRGKPLVSVFFELGIDPLITAAKGSFVDELIELAGGVNIAHGEGMRYPKYSIEEVVNKDPDVIIIVGMDKEMGRDINSILNRWTRFRQMKAVARCRIFLIDSYLVCSPNPAALTEGLEEIAKVIHPEVFKEK